MRALVAVVLVLAFAPVASAGLPNPCALLTNAEVGKALGSKVESRQEQHFQQSRGRTCQWTGVNLARPTSYAVHRTLVVTLFDTSKAQFENFAARTPGSVRVAGVGQVAYRQGNGNITNLEVWQSGHELSFIVSAVTDPLPAEKLAAGAALARL